MTLQRVPWLPHRSGRNIRVMVYSILGRDADSFIRHASTRISVSAPSRSAPRRRPVSLRREAYEPVVVHVHRLRNVFFPTIRLIPVDCHHSLFSYPPMPPRQDPCGTLRFTSASPPSPTIDLFLCACYHAYMSTCKHARLPKLALALPKPHHRSTCIHGNQSSRRLTKRRRWEK